MSYLSPEPVKYRFLLGRKFDVNNNQIFRKGSQTGWLLEIFGLSAGVPALMLSRWGSSENFTLEATELL
jgi:hypothetical protein